LLFLSRNPFFISGFENLSPFDGAEITKLNTTNVKFLRSAYLSIATSVARLIRFDEEIKS
jgi:hypothetical protein